MGLHAGDDDLLAATVRQGGGDFRGQGIERDFFMDLHGHGRGIEHRFVVAGALPSFDGERLLADTQKICEAEIRFWHGNGAQAGRKAPHKAHQAPIAQQRMARWFTT